MLFAQQLRHAYQLFHGVVRRADDPGTEKQPADTVAPVEIQGQRHHFLGGEACTRHIAGATVDAVLAVVEAEIGQENLQQRHATTVRRIAVADAHAVGRTQPALALGAALGRTAAGAGGVVLGGVGENAELVDDLHGEDPVLVMRTVSSLSDWHKMQNRIKGSQPAAAPTGTGAGPRIIGCTRLL